MNRNRFFTILKALEEKLITSQQAQNLIDKYVNEVRK